MRKNIDTVSILPGALTLNLMIIAGTIFYKKYRISKNVLFNYPGVSLLLIIILLLLLQILILYRRKRKYGGSMVFVDLDAKGIPAKIFEVSEQDVVHFCKAEFSMVFRIKYWPTFRKRLLKEQKNDTPESRIAAQLYREGCAITTGDFVAFLEYTDRQGRHARLSTLAAMPTAADGAFEIIRGTFLRTWVFRTPKEFAMWEFEMPESKRSQFRMEMHKFLRRRTKEIG
jgi:hypothetical protein